jgi:hypothetical protein
VSLDEKTEHGLELIFGITPGGLSAWIGLYSALGVAAFENGSIKAKKQQHFYIKSSKIKFKVVEKRREFSFAVGVCQSLSFSHSQQSDAISSIQSW